MGYSHKKVSQENDAVQRYTRYLNGPGRVMIDNLEEGDSFVMETEQHKIEVKKELGKAVVRILPLDTD